MITGGNVLAMLIPTGGWYIAGNEYENIQFLECDPITKEEFEAGFAKYEAWKAEEDAKKVADKAALLDRLGITSEEARLLLS
jgi:hypothetical protein